jgi:hypothetical protein
MIDSVVRRLRLATGKAAALTWRRRLGAGSSAESWAGLRAPTQDRDRVLLSDTHLWLRRVPPRLHPKQLCRHHPRLANRLAGYWDDRAQVLQFIDDLLIDRRGGRKGLPDRVRAELQLLGRFQAMRLAARRDMRPVSESSRRVVAEAGAGAAAAFSEPARVPAARPQHAHEPVAGNDLDAVARRERRR